jgi:hypothetical protein
MALDAFRKQCDFLSRACINIFEVDKQMKPRRLGSHDLVGCCTQFDATVKGLISIEIKTGSGTDAGWRKRVASWEQECKEKFESLQEQQFQSLLLLSTRFQHGVSTCSAEMLHQGKWHSVVGRMLVPRMIKPTFEEVCAELTWFPRPRAAPVALCKHFLQAMKMSTNAVANRVGVWNRMLKTDGRLELARVRFLPGKPAWVGNRSTFEKLHKFL